MTELLEYFHVDLISLGIVGALWLRRLARLDGHHELRVVILTGLLWVPTVYLVLLCSPLSPPLRHSCLTTTPCGPGDFCITE